MRVKSAALVLIALLFMACKKQAPAPPAIPASFFAMTFDPGEAYPAVTVGAMGHPSPFAWAFIERQPGVYDFAGYDTYIGQGRAYGLVDSRNVAEVTVTFAWTPPWAALDTSKCRDVGSVPVCASPPAHIADWTNLVTAVVHHYNGADAEHPHIAYYELWNEFSSVNFWTGTNAQMVEMAAAAYPVIHTDPYSLLLAPSVSGPVGTSVSGGIPEGLAWMTAYLQAGGSRYADGGAFHGYVAGYSGLGIRLYPWPEEDSTEGCAPGNPCFGSIVHKTQGFRKVFDDNGLAGKPMIDTEGSWGKNENLTDPSQQANWIARWFILQASFYPRITQVAWYGWGLDGGVLSPQAVVAYNTVVEWLTGAAPSAPCARDATATWTCPFVRRGGYRGLVVWTENPAGLAYTPPANYTRSRSLSGTVRKLFGDAITIGPSPLLLE